MRVEKLKRQHLAQKMIDSNTETVAPGISHKHNVDMSDPNVAEWQKHRSLQQIQSMREYTKGATIEKVLAGHIRCLQHMYVTPGKPSFFNYTLKNNFPKATVFQIGFTDPDREFLPGEEELTLVNDHH